VDAGAIAEYFADCSSSSADGSLKLRRRKTDRPVRLAGPSAYGDAVEAAEAFRLGRQPPAASAGQQLRMHRFEALPAGSTLAPWPRTLCRPTRAAEPGKGGVWRAAATSRPPRRPRARRGVWAGAGCVSGARGMGQAPWSGVPLEAALAPLLEARLPVHPKESVPFRS